MSKTAKTEKNPGCISFRFMVILLFAFLFTSAKTVQAETIDITLKQFHPDSEFAYQTSGLDGYFETIYPRDGRIDYKKFMNYTYKISDDSIIGLKANTEKDAVGIFMADEKGKTILVKPYNIVIYALGPGKATLTVYDKGKLIDKFNITVTADTALSPSSYVDLLGDDAGDTISYTDKKSSKITKAQIKKEHDLIKKFAKAAADPKNTSTNQRVLTAVKSVINLGITEISEKQYNQLEYEAWKKGISFGNKYRGPFSALIEKKAIYRAIGRIHYAVLSNLGYQCVQYDDANSILMFFEYAENDLYRTETVTGNLNYVEFKAVNKLETDYDFQAEDPESPYRKSHLPAWLIGQDTKSQVLSEGKTITLPSSDLNKNMYSSDTSVVTVENGRLTGVKPGVAIVYRYNDTYCDMFYVLVKKQGAAKTIQSKVYTTTTKSYFSDSDYAPFIKGGQEYILSYQIDDWKELRIYELERIFGKGADFTTKYSNGQLDCYMTFEGETKEICTIGTGR